MPGPDAHLARARELVDEARDELELAKAATPSFCLHSLRFLRAELAGVTRRIENIGRVLGQSPPPPPAA